MRVGFDVAPLSINRAGERRYALELLGALRALGEPQVAELTLARHQPGGMVHRLVYQGLAEALYYPFLLGRQARRAGADLVHHPRHLVPPELGLPGPSIVTVHDVLPLSRPEYFSRLILHRYTALARGAVRRARLVLTGSRNSAGEIADRLGVPPDRIRVTPYGVGERFRPLAVEPAQPYVLCVGTLEPRKNLAGAVAAFDAVSAEFPEHRLVVVGGRGWKRGGLERTLGSSAARIDRRGQVSDDDLVRLYSGADCFLFPTLGEGFGFPVLEAMACGTPVVTSDRDGLPELAGGAALLADPIDRDALAAALSGVLSSAERRAELRERGLARAKRFSWAECARLTVEAYSDALAGDPR
jgi:glycosyltransferase involved in cell wall biosynthesis